MKGFTDFSLVRMSESGFSVSVLNDKGSTDESIRVARDWSPQQLQSVLSAPGARGARCKA